jgi:hypothetical protein
MSEYKGGMGEERRGGKERMNSPLEQFSIKPYMRIGNNYIDISITNISTILLINIIILIGVFIYIYNNNIYIPYINNKIRVEQSINTFKYLWIEHIINIGTNKTIQYIPFILSI